jgi:hypothetical protein
MSKVLKILGVLVLIASAAAVVWCFFLNDSVSE